MSKPLLIIGNKNYSSWSLRPWLALSEGGIAFDEKVLNMYDPNWPSHVAAHSPTAKVPVLKDGETTVWESLAILEYIAERWPDSKLWPDGLAARTRARVVATEMHAGFAPLRQNMPMDVRTNRAGQGRTPEVAKDIARICQVWTECRNQFSDGGPFLFGRFSNADAMYAPVVWRLIGYGVELEPVPAAYCAAMLALPGMKAWAAAAKAEPWKSPKIPV